MFLFLVNLKATKLEIVQGVKLLKEAYPEDVDPKLTDELLNFHLYVRQTQSQGLTDKQTTYFLMKTFIKLYARKNLHNLSYYDCF